MKNDPGTVTRIPHSSARGRYYKDVADKAEIAAAGAGAMTGQETNNTQRFL